MPIDSLTIENFKGISNKQEFLIKPLTVICGPNSSGKSSCIHALAALAQTTKLSASQVPIILDDEYAQIHLGRFLDVIHSKSIKDSFSIGVSVKNPKSAIRSIGNKPSKATSFETSFSFKAKSATQEIYIQSAEMRFGEAHYSFQKKNAVSSEYLVKFDGKKMPFMASLSDRFGLQVRLTFKTGKPPSDTEINAYLVTESVNLNLNAELSRTLYLGPFRQGPLRKYPTRGAQPTEVGAAGEAAVTMLANEFARSKNTHPNLAKVSNWISQLGLGTKVSVHPVAKTDLVDVSLTLSDGAELPLPDLGYGVSQVLPVLVQCAFAPKHSTLLFEQPELHLHEGAAKKLASVFVDVIRDKSVHIVAETHSPHLFLEVIREVRAGRIKPEDVVLYDVIRKDGSSRFREVKIKMDADGYCEVDHPWTKNLA